jgi:hypothetical protein
MTRHLRVLSSTGRISAECALALSLEAHPENPAVGSKIPVGFSCGTLPRRGYPDQKNVVTCELDRLVIRKNHLVSCPQVLARQRTM